MDIKIDSYNILESGSVITHDNKNVLFRIAPLQFTLEFKTIKDSPVNIETVSDDKSMRIILTNFNNPIGQGIVRPINVGTINEKDIYIQFVVYSLGDTGSKVIHYTWMETKTEGHGAK